MNQKRSSQKNLEDLNKGALLPGSSSGSGNPPPTLGGSSPSPSPDPGDSNILLRQLLDIYARDLTNLREETYKKLAEVSNSLKINKKKTEELTNEHAKQIEILAKDKINLIEILGVFVAIFTFISVEIKILQGVDDYLRIAGLSVLLFSGLALFIYLLFIISEKWVGKTIKHLWLGFVVSFILALIGIGLVNLGDHNNPASIVNNSDFIKLNDKSHEQQGQIHYLNSSLVEVKNKVDGLDLENKNLKEEVRILRSRLESKK